MRSRVAQRSSVLAVDTNVVVRLLTNDDPAQARRAAAFFADHEIFIAVTVLLETEWVLRHAYDLERSAILRLDRKSVV